MSRWLLIFLVSFLVTPAFAAVRFTNAVSAGGAAPVHLADLNGDGRLDLITATETYVQLPNGTLQWKMSFSDVPFLRLSETGDFNGDGKVDLLRATNVWLGLGNGTFTNHTVVPWGAYDSEYHHVRVADCNQDGNLDLVTFAQGTLQAWLGSGTGEFTRAAGSNEMQCSWGKLGVADFNRDGLLDVVFFIGERHQSNNVVMLHGRGDGTFTNAATYVRFGYDRAQLHVADLNLDDAPDVVIAGFYLPEAQSFLGQSNGLAPSQSSGRNAPFSFQLADVNGDGFPDQLVADYLNLWVSLGRGDGTFTNESPLLNGPGGNFVVGDYNGDLKPDLAVAGGSTVVLTNYSDMVASTPRMAFHSRAPDVLRWPVLSNGFFGVEFRRAFNSNFPWMAVSNVPVRNGTNYFVTNAPATPRGFYRLRRD